MKSLLGGLAAIALTLTFALSPTAGHAADSQAAPITVADAWARASAGMAKAGAAFMTIKNTGADDKLVAASADVSDRVELHTHIHDGDVMRMRKVDAIDVPANGEAVLAPGGYHIMFLGLKAPLKEGETFPLTLTFEHGGKITVDVTVKAPGAMGGGGMHKMKHDKAM